MGNGTGQGSIAGLVFFLDENHCRNPHMIAAIVESGFRCEKHHDHFLPGTEDVKWLPIVASNGWSLVTTDARIRTNFIEKEAVRINRARMFYFSRNNSTGVEIGATLRRALPGMAKIIETKDPPFTASITKSGQVTLRDKFEEG